MWEQDIAATRERYRQRWNEHGYDPRTLGWNKGCQSVRFHAALDNILPEECASVLDVGCGFGDLLTYLRDRQWEGSYTGVDIVPELVAEATRRHGADPQARFLNRALISDEPLPTADVVVSLGVFNHRLVQDSLAFVQNMLDAMWQRCRHVVVCDFLSSAAEPAARQENLFYAEPSDIFAIGRRLSRRVMIHHAYMPFEFMVKIWRDQSFAVEAPVFAPYAELARAPAREDGAGAER